MALLTGSTIASTYEQLLKITSEDLGADASAKYVEDGKGIDSALSLSTTRVGIGTASPSCGLNVAANEANYIVSLVNSHADGHGLSIQTNGDEVDEWPLYVRTDTIDPILAVAGTGHVGIGTHTPVKNLDIRGNNSDVNFRMYNDASGSYGADSNDYGFGIQTTSQYINISTFGTGVKPICINPLAGSFVGIGTVTPGFGDDGDEALTNATALLEIAGTGEDTEGATLSLRQTATDIHNTGDYILGMIKFCGNDIYSTEDGVGAMILARATATWTAATNDYPTDLQFHTNPDGAAAMTERFRIDSAGAFHMFTLGAGTLVSNSSGGISISSDARLKTVKEKLDKGLEYVSQLNPVYYNWKEESGNDTENLELGFIAQEVDDAIPGASPISYHEDGTEKWRGYNDRTILAVVVKAVQELSDKVDALENA
jgi:hypothetical protein